jgi:UDP-N-acetylmuramoyl-tripeptide--D-alanyl-D-alanine ligase
VSATHGQLILGNPGATLDRVSIDTRTLKPGDLFFAITGPRHDGHDYLKEATERGALGVVVKMLDERASFDPERIPQTVRVSDTVVALQDLARHIRRRCSPTVVGITGSNGKTTTKDMLTSILKRTGETLATRGNLNNHLGLPLTLLVLEPHHRFAVLEMGASREGDIALLAEIARPHVGVITQIGKAHLEGLKTPEGVLRAKRALFDSLPSDGTAVINADDALLMSLAGSLNCHTIFFGLNPSAEVRATQIQEDTFPLRFLLHVSKEQMPVRLSASGRFQVMDALAAAAAAQALGVSLADIVAGLESFRPAAMRMQVLSLPQGALLINDAYNANPVSMRTVVESFCRSYPSRPRWLVLGDMRELGEQSRREHEELGKWLITQPVQRIFLYGRETRFIAAGAEKLNRSTVRIERFRKKRYLIEVLRSALRERPAVLFKGSRAMKLEQVVEALMQ